MTSIASEAVVGAEVHRPRRLVLDRAIAGCFGLAAALHVGLGARGLLAGTFVAILVELAAIDLERRILPNRIVLPSLVAVLGIWLALDPSRLAESIVSALAAGTFLLLPSLARRGAVGMGDVKLAFLLGAALGKLVAAALLVGLSAVGGFAFLLLLARGRSALRQEIPLGPFLAGGAIVAILLAAPTAI
jgi:prepilin signal peptidase PulO-like enzyme (type II secretory pathway)